METQNQYGAKGSNHQMNDLFLSSLCLFSRAMTAKYVFTLLYMSQIINAVFRKSVSI